MSKVIPLDDQKFERDNRNNQHRHDKTWILRGFMRQSWNSPHTGQQYCMFSMPVGLCLLQVVDNAVQAQCIGAQNISRDCGRFTQRNVIVGNRRFENTLQSRTS